MTMLEDWKRHPGFTLMAVGQFIIDIVIIYMLVAIYEAL
jgi:hypothetical protein